MKERDYKIDILRILCCYAVIVLHTACEYIHDVRYDGMQILGLNFYHAITRFAVPSFVMITGAMSLGKDCRIDKKWWNKIVKFVVLYLVYSVIYSVFAEILKQREDAYASFGKEISYIIHQAIEDPKYHLWYIPMYIGLCLSIPVLTRLRKCTDAKKIFQYLIALFVILRLTPNTLDAFQNERLSLVSDILGRIKGDTFLMWSAFLIIGYYIYTYNLKYRKWLYAVGTAGIFISLLLSNIYTMREKEIVTDFYDDLTLFSAVWAIAVFTFFRNREWNFHMSEKMKQWIVSISGKTLGIYLVHLLILNGLNKLGINAIATTSWIATPLVSILVFVLSFLLVSGMQKIPIVKKWLV
ncbi:MAG: acyltransferase [Lachnospiraceae bacterium]